MLEELKKKKRSQGLSGKAVTAWVLFGAIILVFIFLDMNPRMGGVAEGGAAAEVNRAIISEANVAGRAEMIRRDPRFGGAEIDRQQAQMQALDDLIKEELASQGAEHQGLMVTDRQVADSILEMDVFHEGGRFRQDRYLQLLAANRLSVPDFEGQRREELLRMRVARLLQAAASPSQFEIDRQNAVRDIKTNTEFLQIPVDEVVKPESIPAADVAAYLAAPESAKKVKDYYEARKTGEYAKGEEVNARHILVKAERGDKASEEAARGKIESIRQRLQKEDFAKVARDVSDDPGSKTKGGELGFFGRGRMVEEFENVAFSLEPKKISDPVQSSFGFHLIEVLEKRPAQVISYEEAKTAIARKLLAGERSEKKIDEVRDLVKTGDMGAVNEWARKEGLRWEETGAFGIEASVVPKVGPSAEYADAAFRLTLEKPLLERLIRQGPNAYVVRHKAAPATKVADKAEDPKNQFMKPEFMRELLSNQRAREVSDRWIKRLREDARVSVAERYGTTGKN